MDLKASGFVKLSTYAGISFPGNGIEAFGSTGVVVKHGGPLADGQIGFLYDFVMGGITAGAAGGVHIHAGTSCDDPQGHYWDSEGGTVADPWGAATMWTTDSKGQAKASFQVSTGHGYSDNIGKVVVVHDSAGEKMACAVLEAASDAAQMKATKVRHAVWQLRPCVAVERARRAAAAWQKRNRA